MTPVERKALAAAHYGFPLTIFRLAILPALEQEGLVQWTGADWELTDKGRTALAGDIKVSVRERVEADAALKRLCVYIDPLTEAQSEEALALVATIRKALS